MEFFFRINWNWIQTSVIRILYYKRYVTYHLWFQNLASWITDSVLFRMMFFVHSFTFTFLSNVRIHSDYEWDSLLPTQIIFFVCKLLYSTHSEWTMWILPLCYYSFHFWIFHLLLQLQKVCSFRFDSNLTCKFLVSNGFIIKIKIIIYSQVFITKFHFIMTIHYMLLQFTLSTEYNSILVL